MGHRDDFKNMLALLEKHEIKPMLDLTFPLDQFRAAYERMMRAEQFGKIILKT